MFRKNQRLNIENHYHKDSTQVPSRIIEKFQEPHNIIFHQFHQIGLFTLQFSVLVVFCRKSQSLNFLFVIFEVQLLPENSGPQNSVLHIHRCVFPSFCNRNFLGSAHCFFGLFCIKFGFNEHFKVMGPFLTSFQMHFWAQN